MDPFRLATLFEQVSSIGIAIVAWTLAVLSFAAWRRERRRRMAIVSIAYAFFALFGLLVFLERYLYDWIGAGNAELVEHGSAFFVLAGLVTFFFAITRE